MKFVMKHLIFIIQHLDDLKHSPDKIFPAVAYIALIPKFLEKLQNEKAQT